MWYVVMLCGQYTAVWANHWPLEVIGDPFEHEWHARVRAAEVNLEEGRKG